MPSKEQLRQIAAMKKLGYSDEQIEEMLEDDRAVDRGEPLPWDMSKEEHKKAMKNANANEHKKPMVLNLPKKEVKKNAPKIEIMDNIYQFLSENCPLQFEKLEIVATPTQKKVEIEYCGESFTLSLTNHRKKKD